MRSSGRLLGSWDAKRSHHKERRSSDPEEGYFSNVTLRCSGTSGGVLACQKEPLNALRCAAVAILRTVIVRLLLCNTGTFWDVFWGPEMPKGLTKLNEEHRSSFPEDWNFEATAVQHCDVVGRLLGSGCQKEPRNLKT